MVRVSAVATMAILASTASAFTQSPLVSGRPAFVSSSKKPNSLTSLEAAPTMVIYWSIKTAIDTAAYALGVTDEVKGTGVWNSFELKREKSDDEDEEKDE